MAAATLSNLTDVSAQSKTIKLLIAGEFFNLQRLQDKSQVDAFQHALETARVRFGHALCQCRRHPLKLQIRLREGKFHMAVWPEEGQLHDGNCIFYREDEQISPATELHSAVMHKEDGTKEVELSFAFSRSTLQASGKGQEGNSRLSLDNQKLPEQASLRGLLHLLWAEANLTRWHPKWSRDWGRTRYELIHAAQYLTSNGEPLSQRLFVPRPYRDSIKEELNQEWDRFVSDLAKGAGGIIKSALLIAPVRKISKLTAGGVAVHLRHLRNPIGMNEATYNYVAHNNKAAIRRIQANEEARNRTQAEADGWIETKQPEVVAILHVEASSRGGLWARGGWLLPVHPTVFIPANNPDEVLLIDSLIDGRYQFSRVLSSEKASQRTKPDWFVRHVYDPLARPVSKAALEILNSGANPEFLVIRMKLAEKLANEGVPLWTWTPAGRQIDHVVPPLPPHDEVNEEEAKAILSLLDNRQSVNYAYGSGSKSHFPT